MIADVAKSFAIRMPHVDELRAACRVAVAKR
jgi:hypothetical protein